jgi:hypothetical protein
MIDRYRTNKEKLKVGDRVVLQDFSDEDWDRHDGEIHGNFFWIKGFDKLIGHELIVNEVNTDGIYCSVPLLTDLFGLEGESITGGFNWYWVKKVRKVEMKDFVPEEMFEI